MSDLISSSVVFAQAIPQGTSLAGWAVGALRTCSLSSLLILITGAMIFGGACYVIATKQRPAVLAAYLVLLPLPVLISFYGVISGQIASLAVIASIPGISITTEDLAGGIASSLCVSFLRC